MIGKRTEIPGIQLVKVMNHHKSPFVVINHHFPDAPCMEYLPTKLSHILVKNAGNSCTIEHPGLGMTVTGKIDDQLLNLGESKNG